MYDNPKCKVTRPRPLNELVPQSVRRRGFLHDIGYSVHLEAIQARRVASIMKVHAKRVALTTHANSCSFRIGFRMYIVGAHESPFSQHVYQLASYGYDRKADLPFAFDEGRCIGYDDKALLCAADDRTNIDNDKKCYYYFSDGSTAEAPSTNEKHHLGEMATNGDNVMIIAGKRTRTFEHFNGEEWTMGAGEVPGPFFKFSSVTFNNVPFIFGGESTPCDVATYQNNAWSMHGL